MKKEINSRRTIFRMVAGFVALVVVAALFSVVHSSAISFKKEMAYDRRSVQTLSQMMEENMDDGDPTPFEFISSREKADLSWGFVFGIINTETGETVSPDNLDPRIATLKFDKGRDFKFFKMDGKNYFALYSDFSHHPLRIIYVSSFRFAFELSMQTMKMFIVSLIVILAIVLLVIWFYILPRAERTLHAKHLAELELSQASKLQNMAVTRKFPSDPRCDVFGTIQPAREVGGDLYGCIVKDNELCFMIGDVSDKGAGAALIMFLLSSLAFPMFKDGKSLLHQARELNNILTGNPNYDMFCTMILGKINLDTRQMQFVNAGHTRMLINGELHNAKTNMPLGILQDFPFEEESITLPEGATLILYTDGVTEERSPERELFGEERLLGWWRECSGLQGAEALCHSLFDRVAGWRGTADQNDDIAILTVKLK